ncbi:vasculin-like protein 1 [Elysia marginata]|uniref:Vasculin-like protein 1 n=1 Tax=Elysia marginata TaxID=1093978 RepID=A0AAV4IZR5_9GAST|nr:vasculin-like protein 1 [Elysia marginata]
MADNNLPKQDFAPPWLKFPQADSTKSQGQKLGGYQGDRNRQRREDPYHSRSDYNRLHRQTSFDYHESKRFPPGQGKYRHHSVDDDYYGYSYGYGYYPPDYNYEKYGMHYSSQPSLARRDGKYGPGRFPPGGADFSPPYELYEPSYHPGMQRRGFYENHMNGRDYDMKGRERGHRDKPYSDDFPSLVAKGEQDVKRSKPVASAWENPPKSNRADESTDNKAASSGIYKALVPSKNGQIKRNGRINGTVRDSSPLSPSSKLNNQKEGTLQSSATDLAIVTQPKKLGDKKSQFLKALRNESTVRNGENGQDHNQNAIEKKQGDCEEDFGPQDIGMNDSAMAAINKERSLVESTIEEEKDVNGDYFEDVGKHASSLNGDVNSPNKASLNEAERKVNGEALVDDVEQICLSGEEEEKRLLLSMGWVEEDNTEYVITEDEIREFQSKLQNHCHGQKNGLKTTLRNALNLKLDNDLNNGMVNGSCIKDDNDRNKLL